MNVMRTSTMLNFQHMAFLIILSLIMMTSCDKRSG